MLILIDVKRVENRPIQQQRLNQAGFLSRHKIVTAIAVGILAAIILWYRSIQCYHFWDCPTSRGICEEPSDLEYCAKYGLPCPVKGYPVVCLCPENVGKPIEELNDDQKFPRVLPVNYSCFRFFREGGRSFFSQLHCFAKCLSGENDPLQGKPYC